MDKDFAEEPVTGNKVNPKYNNYSATIGHPP